MAVHAPANIVTWYDAAAYCNWLSEQEGIPKTQWCYDPDQKFAEGMKLPADYLSRTGYRLPSEAEWEFACRAGTISSRYYGHTEPRVMSRGPILQEQNSENILEKVPTEATPLDSPREAPDKLLESVPPAPANDTPPKPKDTARSTPRKLAATQAGGRGLRYPTRTASSPNSASKFNWGDLQLEPAGSRSSDDVSSVSYSERP